MHMRVARRRLAALTLILVGAVWNGVCCGQGPALTTKSPEVLSAIDRGIKYLESDAAKDDRTGAHALVGIAILKAHPDQPDHPKVLAAIARIQKAIENRDLDKANPDLDIYSTGLSIIFLIERDPIAHRADIEFLLAYLRARQKKHGGWGYPGRDTGDTSMTQYGVLSSWEARYHGFNVPMESIDAVANWLLRTQDPSGAFGYQGTIAENVGKLVPQQEVRHSMAAAGLGALYLCSHMLGMAGQPEKPAKEERIPSALREIKPKNARSDPSKYRSKIDPKLVREAEERGNGWFDANFKVEVAQYNLYYLYALERYKSIAELCDKNAEKDPQWYSDVAQFLIEKQSPNGIWNSGCGEVPDTAFGVLFLLRSMKRSIEKAVAFGEGTMIGGRGFPKDTGDLVVDRHGQAKQRKLLGPADELIDALDDPEGKDFDRSIEQLPELPQDKIESLSAKHAEMIRRLVSNKKWEARLAAVKVLGKTRDLDNVPVLIYALGDPVPDIAKAANDGLLRISRNPTLVRFPDKLTDSERRAIIEKWKAWYQTIRPGADLDL
ncbi:MAG: prenyltransferase/squalene oxidase repeat-containing protein [Thermoguttaceae bacterium]